MALYSDSNTVQYRKLLNAKMPLVVWNLSLWAQFIGLIGKGEGEKLEKYGSGILKPTGKPIEVLKDFSKGGLGMDIPVLYSLTGSGVAGGVQLLGTEEQIKYANKTISVNQIRHGVLVQDNKMSKQALRDPKQIQALMGGAAAKIQDWFSRWLAFQPSYAFLTGYSEHLTRSVALGGLAKTKKSHMNTYVAGSGKVTFSNTVATYEAAVATALTGLTDTASDYMSTSVIENMVFQASNTHRIQPMKVGGNNYYCIVISDAAAKQLQRDSDWRAAQKDAAVRGDMNSLFTGKLAGVYAGALIFIDETLPAAYITGDSEFTDAYSTTADSTGVQYGQYGSNGIVSCMATPVDAGNRKPAILFGQSAIACGVRDDLSFESEEYDYKQKQTEGGDMIVGMEIADIVDTDGYFGLSGDKRKENVSSLVAWTYSPSTILWT